jgi:hypothetical protein
MHPGSMHADPANWRMTQEVLEREIEGEGRALGREGGDPDEDRGLLVSGHLDIALLLFLVNNAVRRREHVVGNLEIIRFKPSSLRK